MQDMEEEEEETGGERFMDYRAIQFFLMVQQCALGNKYHMSIVRKAAYKL